MKATQGGKRPVMMQMKKLAIKRLQRACWTSQRREACG